MAIEDYKKALKMGRKEYQSNLSQGIYPYLQVLEEITSNVDVESEITIGDVQVPLDKIVGTNGRSRGTAFARNYMPLLDEDTEFARKWANLCDIHIEEGIRDPIKCYEFMNRFYVVEGNKRVSVLKYFDAVSIAAHVTRIVPRRTDTLESKIYFEFLDFYRITGINYVWFTKEGNFQKLLDILQKTKKADWDQEFSRDFRSAYYRFRKAYTAKGGRKLSISTGDAMLEYLKVFGYEGLLEKSHAQLMDDVAKMWDEICLQTEEKPIGLVTHPIEEPNKKGLFNFLSGSSKKTRLKVGFVHDKDRESSSWTYGHELGRMHVDQVFADQVETYCVDNIFSNPKGADQVLEELADSGFDVIFTTTPQLVESSLKAAIKHPEIKFLNCSVNMSYRYLRTYYGRMYEPKFLTGAIAGCLTRTDRIGYVADYPISGMIANINAFALGARLVNPRAKIYLEWSTLKDGGSITERMQKMEVDFISNQDLITPGNASRKFGLYRVDQDNLTNIAMPMWHWGKFYEKLIRSILSGSWNDEDYVDGSKAINYWWGMSAGVVDLVCSQNLPEGTKHLLSFLKRTVISGEMDPFTGYIRDQEGKIQVQEDECLSTEKIVTMNWLTDTVIGKIPAIDELREDVQSLVQLEGLTVMED